MDGPEPPILDGSAAQFVFLLDCAGPVAQDAPRLDHRGAAAGARVSEGDAFAELRPAAAGIRGLDMALSIDFAAPAIGRQALSLRLTPTASATSWPRARTFTLAEEVDELRAAGLAQGGSLDNAVVVDQARVLNPAGLRVPDEFVRHKLMDAVGDLALAGAPLWAGSSRTAPATPSTTGCCSAVRRTGRMAGERACAASGRRRIVPAASLRGAACYKRRDDTD